MLMVNSGRADSDGTYTPHRIIPDKRDNYVLIAPFAKSLPNNHIMRHALSRFPNSRALFGICP